MSVIIRGKNPRKPNTVRYWAEGRQREKSFVTSREARDFKAWVDHSTRARIYADDSREPFGGLAEAYLSRLAVTPRSRATYQEVWQKHVAPVLSHRALSQVARDRDSVTNLLTSDTLGSLSVSRRRMARRIVTGTLDEAVRAGKIAAHRCDGIELADRGARDSHDDFVFPSHAQVSQVARRCGVWVWLARGCGLRISEALAVERDDFREDGAVLRVSRQVTRDGQAAVPLKHRKASEYRDVPVPSWLWQMVRDSPAGPLSPGFGGRKYMTYRTQQRKFSWEAAKAGIPAGFTPHSLRHAYASALLNRLVPISDVATWMGHKDINTTFSIYGHLVPSALGRAVAALDDEFASWTD